MENLLERKMMPSKSMYRNSEWITIPFNKIGTSPQQERWGRTLQNLADLTQKRWRKEYPVNPRAIRN
tara:strand:+ start:494 stop:694 length:201 start_codon:yes stop_codon:yes gene_type:complete